MWTRPSVSFERNPGSYDLSCECGRRCCLRKSARRPTTFMLLLYDNFSELMRALEEGFETVGGVPSADNFPQKLEPRQRSAPPPEAGIDEWYRITALRARGARPDARQWRGAYGAGGGSWINGSDSIFWWPRRCPCSFDIKVSGP